MLKLQSLLDPGFDKIGELFTIPQGEISNPTRRGDFNYNSVFYNIVIVGLGGTGGYAVRDLSRFLYSIQRRDDDFRYRLSLVDGDEVEEKNLLRQNFLPRDLGQNKAIALAERHSRAFGLDIEAFAKKIETEDDLATILKPTKGSLDGSRRMINVIIGCIDNNKARRTIDSFFKRKLQYGQSYFWIDSGNERKGGQVICGGGFQSRSQTYSLPVVTQIYPEILDESQDTESQVSCAERMMQDEQNIFVNIDAATHVLNFTRKIILAEDFNIHGVEFNIDGKVAARHLAAA